jgi:hypothetical protein
LHLVSAKRRLSPFRSPERNQDDDRARERWPNTPSLPRPRGYGYIERDARAVLEQLA